MLGVHHSYPEVWARKFQLADYLCTHQLGDYLFIYFYTSMYNVHVFLLQLSWVDQVVVFTHQLGTGLF